MACLPRPGLLHIAQPVAVSFGYIVLERQAWAVRLSRDLVIAYQYSGRAGVADLAAGQLVVALFRAHQLLVDYLINSLLVLNAGGCERMLTTGAKR